MRRNGISVVGKFNRLVVKYCRKIQVSVKRLGLVFDKTTKLADIFVAEEFRKVLIK